MTRMEEYKDTMEMYLQGTITMGECLVKMGELAMLAEEEAYGIGGSRAKRAREELKKMLVGAQTVFNQ